MHSNHVVVDATLQTEIISELCSRLRAGYVFPDIAEQICAALLQRLNDRAYDDIHDGETFSLALTLHMQEVSPDEHLWVRYHSEPVPDGDAALHQNREWMDTRRREAEFENYGFHKVERLSGNVGYVDIRRLHKAEWGGATAAASMHFLAKTKALIIDLRRCSGGYPGMVALICSYFFDDPVHLNSIHWRDEDGTQQYWTLPYVPGSRFGDKPVYLLTSQYTFSGGEELAYNLKARKRATLVGERTGGGAHAGSAVRLHPHFEAFIPSGRAINPVTQENWQGRGVEPDVSVSHERALHVAYGLALASIIEDLGHAHSGADGLLQQEARQALEELESGAT